MKDSESLYFFPGLPGKGIKGRGKLGPGADRDQSPPPHTYSSHYIIPKGLSDIQFI